MIRNPNLFNRSKTEAGEWVYHVGPMDHPKYNIFFDWFHDNVKVFYFHEDFPHTYYAFAKEEDEKKFLDKFGDVVEDDPDEVFFSTLKEMVYHDPDAYVDVRSLDYQLGEILAKELRDEINAEIMRILLGEIRDIKG